MLIPIWYLITTVVSIPQVILQQPHITPPKHSEFRELVWSDLNIIHTTDTHGWYAGHLNQKPYSADWGDFVSLSHHFRNHGMVEGVDVLFVDTGDKHDGNGLSDATTPNGIISTTIFNGLEYDLVTIGNHELYYEEYSTLEYEVSVQHHGDRYVSSNVEYLLDNGTYVPFGNKFRYFQTRNQKKKVLALSFLFNFQRYNDKTRVFPIQDVLKQDWFIKLTQTYNEDNVDVLIVFGHIPVTDFENQELSRLHVTLRRWFPNIFIQYLGGHSHIRDFVKFDDRSTGLQSGRYCETLGFVSLNYTSFDINRRYIDFNMESFKHHVQSLPAFLQGDHEEPFDTSDGKDLSLYIKNVRDHLNLSESYGYVPSNYLMNGHPISHPQNIYTFLSESILPELPELHPTTDRAIIINSGGIRYDLYKGNYTRDSEFIISPFKNDWNYIKLPRSLALKIAPFLNKGDFIMLSSPDSHYYKQKSKVLESFSGSNALRKSCEFKQSPNFKKGLTTLDDFGCDGDDVEHNTVPYYPSPNVVQSFQTFTSSDQQAEHDLIDVVFYSFIQSYIIDALNTLDEDRVYRKDQFKYYGGVSTGQLLTGYVKKNWA